MTRAGADSSSVNQVRAMSGWLVIDQPRIRPRPLSSVAREAWPAKATTILRPEESGWIVGSGSGPSVSSTSRVRVASPPSRTFST
jgi:hypothetical protein